MRRTRFQKQPVNVSLFPFLAVLVCTMGALIVLLVMVVQQARVQASSIAEQRSAVADAQQKQSERQLLLEEHQWRREMLEQQRQVELQSLANKRLELSHLEEHIRSLEEKFQELKASAATLEKLKSAGLADGEMVQAKWAHAQSVLDDARRRLEEAERQAAEREPSYALVPYDGPNGTRRRPIYIECRADGIYLQPEDIVFGAEDFRAPLGPGNPLDAALRAIREYWTRYGAAGEEPYPLLLVRPDGAEAYAAARTAMKTWDDEFGYELLGEGMKLKYPEPDPQLKKLLARAVMDARQRQQLLAAAMPSRYPGGMPGFRVNERHGGVYPVNGAQDLDYERARAGRSGSGGKEEFSQERRALKGPKGDPNQLQEEGKAGMSLPGALAGKGDSGEPSPAHTKGRDWALPNKARGLTAITRPIQVVCTADNLVILPERGDTMRLPTTPLHGPTRASIDAFVSDVWDHVERWGIAVAGGYWQPVLQVRVQPGGEGRFEDLQHLLADSGLQVERKWR